MPLKYDQLDPTSIEIFGKRLIGKCLREVIGEVEIPQIEADKSVSGRTRGSLGNIVEKYYYGITPESDGTPDFLEARVELKTTPIKKLQNGDYSAKERLVLGMIDYIAEADKDFSSSSYFKKNEKLMLLSYLHEDNKLIGDVEFMLAKLYEFNNLPQEDQRIIREDWGKINQKLKAGLAHELSEGDTLYLGACTKSATGGNRRTQVGGVPAKPRAYSYKSSYMTQLLRRELGIVEDSEKVVKTADLDVTKTFEQQVEERFGPYIGKTVSQIESELGLNLKPTSKGRFATVARAIMGVKKHKIEEFEAAGVMMKTVQLRGDGKPKEHMSFPTFKYKEIVNEIWDGDEEDGDIRAAIQKRFESRFFFVVFKCTDQCKKDEERTLEKAFFWSMPQTDLEEVHRVWLETINRIKAGQAENLPGAKWSPVSHVRPHAANKLDTYETPQGDNLTKKCFWLNQDYIKKQIENN